MHIHVPPPPPNQIIRVGLDDSIDAPELWGPFELDGVLHVAQFDADIASASYQVEQATLRKVER